MDILLDFDYSAMDHQLTKFHDENLDLQIHLISFLSANTKLCELLVKRNRLIDGIYLLSLKCTWPDPEYLGQFMTHDQECFVLLQIACVSGDPKVCQMLLDRGVDVDDSLLQRSNDMWTDPDLEIPSNNHSPLMLAVLIGNLEMCQFLYSSGARFQPDSKPMTESIKRGFQDITQWLMLLNVHPHTEDLEMLIELATHNEEADVLLYLRERQKMADIIVLPDELDGETFDVMDNKENVWIWDTNDLLETAKEGDVTTFKNICDFLHPDNALLMQCLDLAIEHRRQKMCNHLIDSFPLQLSKEQVYQIGLFSIKLLKQLLDKKYILKKDQASHLLFTAVQTKQPQCIPQLLQSHADPTEIYKSKTALMIAKSSGQQKVYQMLSDVLKKEQVGEIHDKSDQKKRELASAVYLKQFKKFQDLIHKKGSDINQALFLAVRLDRVDMIRVIMKEWLDFNYTDPLGRTCLHIAVNSSYETMKMLLQKGFNPNFQNYQGDTPLHEAALANRFDCCELLIEFGADPLIRNLDANRPIEMTTSRNLRGFLEQPSRRRR
ncbi:ankyrin repeat-containing domain protein [Gorgonomyces haynaldii]|nr:ankyrin repeat-containing domain protein [Gorgonomyces haynaldii]